jgi:hypothetical protein
VPHAFRNPTDAPARVQEIVSPGGVERYFEEMADALAVQGAPDFARLGAIPARYGLEMDFGSIPRLAEQYGLRLPLS